MNTLITKPQNKIKWDKGEDFMDGLLRYTFEGRDPSYTVSDIKVVITTERKRKYWHDSQSVKNFYTGYVRHEPTETADYTEEFESIAQCKKETEKLFNEYCELFPNSIEAY
ncbi:MAG: hypothetical protein PHD20_02740 [Clostridia bacterium]|nr:hypothetical protein [Clostridia bacterium]